MPHIKPPYPRLQRGKLISDGLVGAWPFYEGSGGTLHDVSGNNNHGTLTNMDPATDWVGGRHGYSLNFDGSDDYVDIDSAFTLLTTSGSNATFTVSAWWKTNTAPSTDAAIIESTDAQGNFPRLIGVRQHTSGYLRVFIRMGGTNIDFQTSTLYGLNVWRHMTLTCGSSTSNILYVNGKQEASNTSDDPGTDPPSGSIWLSATRDNTPRCLDAQINDVRIYDRALSANEIRLIYAGLG